MDHKRGILLFEKSWLEIIAELCLASGLVQFEIVHPEESHEVAPQGV